MDFEYFHAQRQSLRQQSAGERPVDRRRHHSRSALCRPDRPAFRLDRRAPLQFPRGAVMPGISCSPISRRAPSTIGLAPAVHMLCVPSDPGVAETWATLDLLSNGRVDFATGRGYDRREYEPLGVDFRRQPASRASRSCLGANGASRITESTTRSTTSRSAPKPVQQPIPIAISDRSRNHRSSSRRGSGAGFIVAPFRGGHELRRLEAGGRPTTRPAPVATNPGRLM